MTGFTVQCSNEPNTHLTVVAMKKNKISKIHQGRIQDLIRGGGGAQIVTGLKLPFWGLSFVEFWCWGLIFGGQGGARAPLDPPLYIKLLLENTASHKQAQTGQM